MLETATIEPATTLVEDRAPAAAGLLPRPASRPRLRKITLLVLDEHPVVQLGVRIVAMKSERDCEIVEAVSGEEAVATARELRPDVVLIDPCLSDMMLAEAVQRVRAVSPASKLIVFAAQVTPSIREEAGQLGVHGLLGKDATPAHFLDVVERVVSGETLLEPELEDALRRAAAKLNCAPLTPREHEIIRRAARGESNAEIARAIFLAPTTVKSYVQSALAKLEARNRVEAVFKLSELRLL